MNKDKFDRLISEKINKIMQISLYRRIKLDILLDEVQKSIIEAINKKNINNEIITSEIKLTEEEYKNYFGNKETEDIAVEYFMKECLENGITCNFHHVKYNTQIFDSYYEVTIKYNNQKQKKLTLK